jgi:hypothetical protein
MTVLCDDCCVNSCVQCKGTAVTGGEYSVAVRQLERNRAWTWNNVLQVFRFSQRCCCEFSSSCTWSRVARCAFSDFSNDREGLILRPQGQSKRRKSQPNNTASHITTPEPVAVRMNVWSLECCRLGTPNLINAPACSSKVPPCNLYPLNRLGW